MIAADSVNILLDIMRFLGTVFRYIKISRFCGWYIIIYIISFGVQILN